MQDIDGQSFYSAVFKDQSVTLSVCPPVDCCDGLHVIKADSILV